LAAGLRKHFGENAHFSGEGCGMHILWRLPYGMKAIEVAAAASRFDVGLYTFGAVGAREFGQSNLAEGSLVLGYSTLSPGEVTEGIKRIALAMDSLKAV
jgi:DNA-binding transcriptional MocR family regulator